MAVNEQNLGHLRQAIAECAVTGEFLPAVYVLEPTSVCNLKCVMCPNKLMGTENFGQIDVQVFNRIVSDIAPYAEFLMLYWMGEPLLHSQLPAMLQSARSMLSGKIVVSTNMTELTAESADALAQYADIVLCCIDRWDKQAFEKVRVGAKFETVVDNTRLLISRRKLRKSGAEIVVKALDINHGSAEWTDFAHYWQAQGARPLLAWLNGWAGTFPKMRQASNLEIPRADSNRRPCADLWFKMVINWKGIVQMCCFDWEYAYPIGKAEQDDWLRKVWHGEKIRNLREIHRNGQYEQNARCLTCDTWGTPQEFEHYVAFNDESYFSLF